MVRWWPLFAQMTPHLQRMRFSMISQVGDGLSRRQEYGMAKRWQKDGTYEKKRRQHTI